MGELESKRWAVHVVGKGWTSFDFWICVGWYLFWRSCGLVLSLASVRVGTGFGFCGGRYWI